MSTSRSVAVWLVMSMIVGLALLQAWAGEDAARETTAAGSAAAAQGIPWRWYWDSGGWIMYALLALSIVALALVVYLFVVLRTGQIVPRPLRRELMEKIRSGALVDAGRACTYRPCPLSSVALAAVEHFRTLPTADPTLLKDVMEGEGARQADSIRGQPQYLLDVAAIAPMVGLFGTVWGMMQAFGAIGLNLERAQPVVLANGVAQALVTTVGGLIIAIPAMLFYAYFRRRAARMVSNLESASTEILTLLLSETKPLR
ncbi:MAG: MotA/TolQ/ExbB proton channel family protein [Verrucomicrobiota bacterium]|nr:MotA/TolQ/ExbB proton channel family protein [Verrucomicrobiota bacterium]